MPCGAAMSVLLFLLWFLVEVHSQTPPAPYLSFMGETLPDHSYVDLSLVGMLVMVVTVYSVTLTCPHAVVVLRVYTVETGVLLVVTLDFHSVAKMVVVMIFMRAV